ncbi:LysR family transcriptional regulator [Alteromonas stellipolaris]|uniref:LysR family transcriptional regulator n=1 Tax=Alteromonas stellipolaris TaxID=233316 RepID=UPI0026E1C75F|nr:LysR family transcriptional regulator [Alteromonas stellipolaris]MDO6540242.1 LysR family transcriptional regulator [Alteromonas stellipolaris]
MLNPLWLDTFKMLVETGNFTRTAEQRFMTQPGVSQHIKKLEDACGCALLIRLGKGVELTEQGQRVYDYALSLSKHEQALIESLKFDAPYEGKCVIGCSGALAQRLYPVLVELQVTHPRLSIHLEVAPNRTILNNIQASSLELGIVTQQPDEELFSSEKIGHESLGLILPKDTPYEAIDDTLLALGLINHPDAMHYLKLYFSHSGEQALMQLDPRRLPQRGYINQLSQILLPVSKGLGFTVLPIKVLDSFADAANSLTIYPARHDVTEPLYFVKTPHRSLPLRYQKIQSLIVEALESS